MSKRACIIVFALVILAVVIGFTRKNPAVRSACNRVVAQSSNDLALIKNPKTAAQKIVNGAKREVIRGVEYDAAYVSISYPNGDVPADRGACTDVVIRSLRSAGYDLQKLVHEDMKSNFSVYPKKWGLSTPDSNIDHRRVPNLMVYFRRFGKTLSLDTDERNAASWKAGDIVCWDLTGNGLTHIGILSNETNRDGLPLIIHNIGPVTSQQDCLNNWQIIGHFRYPR